MDYKLLHIFRNTPFGRETFLQSLYFCRTIHATPHVYIPESDKFLMYFSNDAAQIDLDGSYLTDPGTARVHVEEICDEMEVKPVFYAPKNRSASSLPDVSTRFDYLCCPRSVSDKSSKIGLGHIGPKVRRIIKHATFPILITSPVFKPWKRLAVLFGGSSNAAKALRLAVKIALASGYPLDIYTLLEQHDEAYYRDQLRSAGLAEIADQVPHQWHFFPAGHMNDMLYNIPHNALVVMGAYGHGLIKEVLFGSKMEMVQSTVTNNLLVTGPDCAIELIPTY